MGCSAGSAGVSAGFFGVVLCGGAGGGVVVTGRESVAGGVSVGFGRSGAGVVAGGCFGVGAGTDATGAAACTL